MSPLELVVGALAGRARRHLHATVALRAPVDVHPALPGRRRTRRPATIRRRGVALVVGALVLSAAATLVLRDVMRALPRSRTRSRGASIGPFLGLAGLCVVGCLFLPEDLRIAGAGVVWGRLGWALGGLRDRRALAVLMVVLLFLPLLGTVEWYAAAYGLIAGAVIVFTVRTSLWLIGVVRELERGPRRAGGAGGGRGAAAVLARPARRDGPAAVDDRGQVRARRDPGRPVRPGRRGADAGGARSGARGDARGARAGPRLPHDRPRPGARGGPLAAASRRGSASSSPWTTYRPAGTRPAAWVVREAVTNVLRHSAATAVAIRYAGSELAVVNDGVVDRATRGRLRARRACASGWRRWAPG